MGQQRTKRPRYSPLDDLSGCINISNSTFRPDIFHLEDTLAVHEQRACDFDLSGTDSEGEGATMQTGAEPRGGATPGPTTVQTIIATQDPQDREDREDGGIATACYRAGRGIASVLPVLSEIGVTTL